MKDLKSAETGEITMEDITKKSTSTSIIIEKHKLSELKLAPYNPRRITKEMMGRLKESIRHFGYVEPIVWNKRTGIVVGGNQRLKALKDMHNKDHEVDVVVVDLHDKQEKALNIALNKITGEFDELSLAELIGELDDDLIKLTGFEDKELSQLLDKLIPNEEPEFDIDKATKEPKYSLQIGDIWQLGGHCLMCGDSVKKEDVDKLMDGNKADMVFTDPPYGISYKSNQRNEKHEFIKNDDKILDFNYALENMTKDTSSIYIFTRWDVYSRWCNSIKLTQKNLIIWNKGSNASMGDLKGNYKSCHEFIMFFTKGRPFLKQGRDLNIWDVQQNSLNNLHPTMKPVELCSRAIKNSSQINQIVLDLFGGSGSTLIACEQLNRKCFMMEIDPIFCSVIIERWENITSKKAIKLPK